MHQLTIHNFESTEVLATSIQICYIYIYIAYLLKTGSLDNAIQVFLLA